MYNIKESCRSTELLLDILQVIPCCAHQLTTKLASFAKKSSVIESLHCMKRNCRRRWDNAAERTDVAQRPEDLVGRDP